MELCANRALSYVPPSQYSRYPPTAANRRLKPSFHLKHFVSPLHGKSGEARKHFSPKASISEETPSEMSKFDGETSKRISVVEDVSPVEKNMFNNSAQQDSPQDNSPMDDQMQPFGELLDKINFKVETNDSYSLLLYGGGALICAWLLSAVVGAIDSIPLFPKLLEVVGFSYSLWFTTRYLIFKVNRDELSSIIEELKQQVVGSDED